jgi:ketosteroid isomerase-like protein
MEMVMRTWRVLAVACFGLIFGSALTYHIVRAAPVAQPICYTDQQMDNIRLIQSIVGSGATASYKTGGQPRFDYLRTVISDDYVGDLSSGMPYGREFRGWQGYQDLSAEIKKFWADLRMVDPTFVPLGDDKVIIHFTLDGRIAKNGQHVVMPVVSIWGVKDGKADSFRVFYFDTKLVTDLAAK